ncbi:hypothetical protein [Salinimicrobium sediminilitoris]|uniref:hypothetical protein n=1 Tax=Salinimicrobium sediminilitoris TaxID=2876715 RepID=UPI001E2E2542|nr:hypothetical protein [Salinimicrobium sediminilitoris]MCC8358910.1 hypothetical protein [Salinimicrobium sediminilitoris]
MMLSEHNRNTLMLFLQQKIEEKAENIVDQLEKGEMTDSLTYPPNGGLTEEENLSLQNLKNDPTFKSALRKILADNSAGVLFELLNIIDGTTDPDEELGEWTEISLVDKTDEIAENAEMLHDELYSKYWDWKEISTDKK